MTLHRSTLLFLAVSFAFACGGVTPQQTLVHFADAIDNDDTAAAYALLSDTLRRDISYEVFVQDWPHYKTQLKSVMDDLRNSDKHPARVSASLEYSDYDTLSMQLSRDGWVITDGLFHFFAQDTPRRTLRSFVRAMEERRYKLLLRFIPSEYAQHMTPESLKQDFERRPDEINTLVQALKANLDNPIQTRRDQAFMRYGDNEITFIQEGNVWKVEDPD